MPIDSNNSKTLVKNTAFLYFRALFAIFVSLYTSRIVLRELGVEDYGVYNVVGGVVSFLSVINSCMGGSASRFVSFALGENDMQKLKDVFSTVKIIHWLLAAAIVLLGETVGLWFVMDQLVIPDGRETAAMICYQASLVTTIVSIVSVPYYSLIIGHEKMGVYAYVSIFEITLRLALVLMLPFLPFDKLITYALLVLIASVAARIAYTSYCRHKFEETKSRLVFKKDLFKEVFSFAMWTFNGQLATAGYTQGINILMNLFFGPVVNAARGISVQVQMGAQTLVNNFQIALRPQMIKAWAQGEKAYLHRLVVISSKFSYYLTAIAVIPLAVAIKPLLTLWLTEIPDHTVVFVRIILFTMLIEAFNHGVIVSIHATGNIRKFQIWEGTMLLTVVPIAWALLHFCSISAEAVMWVYFFVQIATQIVRIMIVLPEIEMSFAMYFKEIFPPVILVTVVMFIPYFTFDIGFNYPIVYALGVVVAMVAYVCLAIFICGLTKNERTMIITNIKKRFNR